MSLLRSTWQNHLCHHQTDAVLMLTVLTMVLPVVDFLFHLSVALMMWLVICPVTCYSCSMTSSGYEWCNYVKFWPLLRLVMYVICCFSRQVQGTGCHKRCVLWVKWEMWRCTISCYVQLRTGCSQLALTPPTSCCAPPTTPYVRSWIMNSTSALPYVITYLVIIVVIIDYSEIMWTNWLKQAPHGAGALPFPFPLLHSLPHLLLFFYFFLFTSFVCFVFFFFCPSLPFLPE